MADPGCCVFDVGGCWEWCGEDVDWEGDEDNEEEAKAAYGVAY